MWCCLHIFEDKPGCFDEVIGHYFLPMWHSRPLTCNRKALKLWCKWALCTCNHCLHWSMKWHNLFVLWKVFHENIQISHLCPTYKHSDHTFQMNYDEICSLQHVIFENQLGFTRWIVMFKSHSDTVVMLVTPHLEPNLHVTEIQLIKIYKHNYDLTDPGITRYNDNNRISISIQMTITWWS